jgi:hypothetical protein
MLSTHLDIFGDFMQILKIQNVQYVNKKAARETAKNVWFEEKRAKRPGSSPFISLKAEIDLQLCFEPGFLVGQVSNSLCPFRNSYGAHNALLRGLNSVSK